MDGTLLVVDAANVVGSVPDGWWRDRAGAAVRLRDRLAAVTTWPELPAPVEVALVVEGRARDIPPATGVRVERATGSGDDAIVALVAAEFAAEGAAEGAGRRCVVVTADRELRARVIALGAEVRGPRWLP